MSRLEQSDELETATNLFEKKKSLHKVLGDVKTVVRLCISHRFGGTSRKNQLYQNLWDRSNLKNSTLPLLLPFLVIAVLTAQALPADAST